MTTTERITDFNGKKKRCVEEIVKWWENEKCPMCGGNIEIDGVFKYGKWREKNDVKPYEYCMGCDFKHYIDRDDQLPADLYMAMIKKTIDGDLEQSRKTEKDENKKYDLPMKMLPERTMQKLFSGKYVAIAKRKIIAIENSVDKIREQIKDYTENGIECQVRYIGTDVHLFGRFV